MRTVGPRAADVRPASDRDPASRQRSDRVALRGMGCPPGRLYGRPRPSRRSPDAPGIFGRWEGDTLVVETTGVAASQTMWWSKHSEQLRVVERFTRSADGATLNLVATLEDLWSLREPLTIKRNWRWAPTSEIAPYVDCEPPIAVKKGEGR